MPCQIGGISICRSDEVCDSKTDRCRSKARSTARSVRSAKSVRSARSARSAPKSTAKTANTAKSNARSLNSSKVRCELVSTIPQITDTCWWNAILVMMLYSQGVRGVIKRKADRWIAHHSRSAVGKRIVTDILKIMASYKQPDAHLARRVFRELTPEHLLETLHEYNPRKFTFDPSRHTRNSPNIYLENMLRFLGIATLNIDLGAGGQMHHAPTFDSSTDGSRANFDQIISNAGRSTVAVSAVPSGRNGKLQIHTFRRRSADSLKRDEENPRIIRLNIDTVYGVVNYPRDYGISQSSFSPAPDPDAMPERFSYRGNVYVADSMYVSNYNGERCGAFHAICGVTCAGRRFMYNGVASFRGTPCELMPFDWIRTTTDLCINPRECGITGADPGEMCFNVGRGRRMYMYVRTD